MRKIVMTGLAGSFALMSAAPGLAATDYDGAPAFIAGDNPPVPGGWNPGSIAALQFVDDGTSGDLTADDGVWTIAVETVPGTPGTKYEFKAAHAGWGKSWPGTNAWSRISAETTTTFFLDTTLQGDGYIPESNGVNAPLVYTLPSPVQPAEPVRAVGSFVSELGGADWTPNDDAGLMRDDGTNGDATAGDGIYTLALTGVPANSYAFQITINSQSASDWTFQVGTNGYRGFGGDFNLVVMDPADNLQILFDSVRGRVKTTNDSPLLNPGPPFYATSSAWSEALGAATRLYDDGTNGDITANDGIHSRGFTTVNGGPNVVRIRQGVGDSYPAAGDGYPIDVTGGQRVLVQFDTNAHSDGFTPTQNYMWTDPVSRRSTDYVQAIGDWMTSAGAAFGDWNNNDSAFRLFDGGTNGDVAAGDAVYAGQFAFIVDGVTDAHFKAIGEQGSWALQFGGNDNDSGKPAGYTINGNHRGLTFSAALNETVTFQVDTATGRIGIGTTIPNLPTRNAPATPSASASDWQLFN